MEEDIIEKCKKSRLPEGEEYIFGEEALLQEDIKVLEEFRKGLSHYGTFEKEVQAIENLIKRYKELELENKTLKAHKNGCPALSTTGVECEFKKDLEKLQEGDK